jgi:hypothetical protein
MELECGQLLKEELQFEKYVFNHVITQTKLTNCKGVFGKFKMDVNLRKFNNEKVKNNGTCYCCDIKGHLIKEYHKIKQD